MEVLIANYKRFPITTETKPTNHDIRKSTQSR